MRYKDRIDLYSDAGECIAEDIPLEAISPLVNPYIRRFLRLIKSIAFVDLKAIETMARAGRAGHTTSLRRDEVQMPWHSRDWPILQNAKLIADYVEDILKTTQFNGVEDDTEVQLFEGDQKLMIKISNHRMDCASGRAPVYTLSGLAVGQAISDLFNITPETDPDGCAFLKNILYGRYPQTVTFQPGNPVSGFLRPPQTQEGIGTGYRTIIINHLAALANKRTLDAVALATMLEQGSQFEMGNALGWYERYNLLGMAYQGFNANNLVLDLVSENRSGTVGDIIRALMQKALETEVIRPKSDKFPDVQPSGYKFYTSDDIPMWNAYTCAGLLAACIVNVGASRAAQCVSAVLGAFGDLLCFESGGFPDPDCGRVMGTGLGFCFYTHSIYGGAGPGAFAMDHVLVKHTSGFFTPCVAAAMCLDAGTQIFSPQMTSGGFFNIREEFPIFQNPLQKIAEAALEIKKKIK